MTRGARPRLLVRGRGRGAAAVKAAALVRAVAAATAVAGGPLPAAAAQPPAAPGGAARFEDLARDAVEVEDLGVLLAPFLDECRDRRELERVRCQTARNFLQARLPGRRFLASRPGTDVISLSEYDAQLKGFRLAVADAWPAASRWRREPGERSVS